MPRVRVAAVVALALGAASAGHAPAARAQAQPPAPEAGARGLASAVVEIMTGLRMVLGSVSNAASARDAGPPLRDLRARLEALARIIHEAWRREAPSGFSGRDRCRHRSPGGEGRWVKRRLVNNPG